MRFRFEFRSKLPRRGSVFLIVRVSEQEDEATEQSGSGFIGNSPSVESVDR